MRKVLLILTIFSALAITAAAQTLMDVQPVKELTPTATLGTCAYRPVEQEQPFFKRLDKSEVSTGSFMAPYSIQGKVGKYVSWYGIVRGISVAPESTLTLLLDNKFFDGMSDCHIMLVSYAGGGDFSAEVHAPWNSIPPLSLVRVYGKVVAEANHVPEIQAEYVRVWPWLTFTFTDLGASDKSNPLWAKYSKFHAGGKIYNPYPKEDYYLRMLGDPKFFGVNFNPDR